MFIFERERERNRGEGETETEHKRGRDREREGDTVSEAGSKPQALSIEPHVGLEPMTHEIMT